MRRVSSGFTLIELLVVIAIVVVLAVTVILTLSPAELLKQARDSTRFSDIASLNTALGLTNADLKSVAFGATTTVYVSLPDSSATCANLGLPTLPAGFSYGCVTTSTLTNVDGTGWLPVNFTALSAGSALSKLPVDPTNSAASLQYYSYVTNASWKLAARPESTKYLEKAGKDGGADPVLFEAGNNLSLAAFGAGMIGYWPMDEGSGTVVYDRSGAGVNGTLAGGITWVSGSSCGLSFCLTFDGVNGTYVGLGNVTAYKIPNKTITFWAKPGAMPNTRAVFSTANGNYYVGRSTGNTSFLSYSNTAGTQVTYGAGSETFPQDELHHYGYTYSVAGTAVTVSEYKDGVLVGTRTDTTGSYVSYGANFYIGAFSNTSNVFNGSIDDLRIYSRALSASEVQALYASR